MEVRPARAKGFELNLGNGQESDASDARALCGGYQSCRLSRLLIERWRSIANGASAFTSRGTQSELILCQRKILLLPFVIIDLDQCANAARAEHVARTTTMLQATTALGTARTECDRYSLAAIARKVRRRQVHR